MHCLLSFEAIQTMNLKVLIYLQLLSQITAKRIKQTESFTNGTRFRSIECKADNLTSIFNFCYIKAVSRRVTTFNVGYKMLKPISKPFYIQLILYYRYGLIYREVIDTKKQDWCEIMNGKSTHLFISQTIAQVKEGAPFMFHKCPYEGEIVVRNLTLNDEKGFDVFPEGIYKFSLLVFDKKFVKFSEIHVSARIKSHLKESMG
ncbi:hypothetical protein ACKWTF_014497 [Chironomus riparius]